MSYNKFTAKNMAIRDIKEDLKEQNKLNSTCKCFIAFRSYLNPVMRRLVSEHLKEQKSIK